ncbi:RGS1-HXK1-interacting protein 1 [Rosa rugosa]|uniref:RGS1-HXK1-interacting protein 1 n=1 Tax=Rosa rugosa TaxID=74645 RepID=UPI002B40D9E7|nr:RGS1-HXK1-interacting protein 1 [Rosa rugosa]
MVEEEPTPTPSPEEKQVLGDDGAYKGVAAEAEAAAASMASMAEDLQRTVMQSRDSAIRSARTLQDNVPEYMDKAVSDYRTYEHAFFHKIKDGLKSATENPASTIGIGLTAAFILLPGPRRFLFRHTLGRFQSLEAKFAKAEKNVNQFKLSVDLMKQESKKLLERAAFAEKEMKFGQTELKDVGSRIQSLSKSIRKVDAQAADLMDGLREIPSGEALKLRAQVAAMTSQLKTQKSVMDKRIMKISELGVPV